MVQQQRIKEREGDGLLDYLGFKCQRTWKRKSGIKYAAVQIRMPGERGEGGARSHLLPSPFLTVTSPLAMAASLFCAQLVLTFPHSLQSDIFSWPFSLLLNFFHTRFPSESLPSTLVGNLSHFLDWQRLPFRRAVTVRQVLPQARAHSSPGTNGQVGARSGAPSGMSILVNPFTAACPDGNLTFNGISVPNTIDCYLVCLLCNKINDLTRHSCLTRRMPVLVPDLIPRGKPSSDCVITLFVCV